jgi:hypothetical protein
LGRRARHDRDLLAQHAAAATLPDADPSPLMRAMQSVRSSPVSTLQRSPAFLRNCPSPLLRLPLRASASAAPASFKQVARSSLVVWPFMQAVRSRWYLACASASAERAGSAAMAPWTASPAHKASDRRRREWVGMVMVFSSAR